jgi:DNA-binding CsgD family transcriptional regulator
VVVPLLERSGELGVLREKARLAVGGTPQFVVIEGPPGIGKTRLLDEFVAENTMRVRRARCDELERELGYGVVRQLFEWTPSGDPCLVAQRLYTSTVDAAPVLLAVDDVHLADEPSLRLLLYLTRHLVDVPVLMVLTLRHRAALTGLVLHPDCTVIRPCPLSPAGTAALLADLLGTPPPAESVRECHELTAGNPLLTRAVGLTPTGPPARVVADLLLVWLADLTVDAQEFARALAVLGDTADVRLPARLAELDPTRAGAACDELRQVGFVCGEPRWTRPFVRETVLGGMPAERRGALHAAAARLLDGTGAQVCDHLLESPPAGDPWVVRTLCAHATHEPPEQAATYLRRALAEPPPARERVAVLVALGTAESYARPDVAVGHFTEALERTDDPATLGRVGRAAADALVRAGRAAEAVELLDAVSDELTDREAGMLLRAHRTVIAAGMAPHLAATVDVDGLAGTTVAERAALGAAAFAGALLGATADRTAELALRALPATSNEMANPSVAHTIGALAWTDRLDAAAQRCDVAIAEARRGRALFAHAVLLDGRATIAWLAGDLDEATALARRAGSTLRPEWWGVLGALHQGTTLRIMVDSGDMEGARQLLPEVDGGDDFPSLYLAAVQANARIASGDVRGGLAAVLDCGDRLTRAGYENPVPIPWRLWGARACVQLGEFDAARHLATAALAHARHWGTARAVGGALHALGRATGGREGLRLIHRGVEALESSPARLDLVQALTDLGTTQHDEGLHREARETLRRALELAERCGARTVVATIRQFLPRTGARRGSRPTTGLAALTESERRIAELAARWTNRKIAEELHLTLRTVETHLSATYRKLGITGRTQLHDLFPADHPSRIPH